MLCQVADPFIGGGWLGERLLTLTREDLADLGVSKDQRGDLMLAVEALRQGEGPVTLPDERAPSYAPQFTPAVVAACRALGREPPRPWVDAVADAWPGPIAHEYHRLRELLADGHIVPAIFQLKDLVEVSIKFPALVMARDLLQHGDAEPPWRDIVEQFANAVHALNPDQRAALLAALGENAEAVKQAFGWQE